MPDRGMAFGGKFGLVECLFEKIRALADLGIALEVHLLRLQSHWY